MNFAGIPPTMTNGSMFFVTMLPGKITAPSPIVTPGIIIAFEKIKTLFPITTDAPLVSKFGESMLCPKV